MTDKEILTLRVAIRVSMGVFLNKMMFKKETK